MVDTFLGRDEFVSASWRRPFNLEIRLAEIELDVEVEDGADEPEHDGPSAAP